MKRLTLVLVALFFCSFSNVYAVDVAVTQITSVTTAVTADGISGIITTFTHAEAAGVSATFTVNNTGVKVGNIVLVSVVDYAGTFTTNGLPIVSVDDIAEDSFKITVSNAHSANALSGVLKIGFKIE